MLVDHEVASRFCQIDLQITPQHCSTQQCSTPRLRCLAIFLYQSETFDTKGHKLPNFSVLVSFCFIFLCVICSEIEKCLGVA